MESPSKVTPRNTRRHRRIGFENSTHALSAHSTARGSHSPPHSPARIPDALEADYADE